MSKWHDVMVSFTVELGRETEGQGPWWDLTYEKLLPELVQEELSKLIPETCEGLELDFDVTSDGYYLPAVMYLRNGDPGYPEEGDDERTCNGVYILLDRDGGSPKLRIPLSKEAVAELEDLYQEEINSADLPEQDHDGPDREDD